MMTHDEMIAVIQHHRDGGKVEYKLTGNHDKWELLSEDPGWAFRYNDYRPYVEPKPKQVVVFEKWVCEYCGGYVVVEGNDLNFMRNEMFKQVKLLSTREIEL